MSYKYKIDLEGLEAKVYEKTIRIDNITFYLGIEVTDREIENFRELIKRSKDQLRKDLNKLLTIQRS